MSWSNEQITLLNRRVSTLEERIELLKLLLDEVADAIREFEAKYNEIKE
jgi:hypothetical protein